MAIRLSVPPNGAIVNGVAHFVQDAAPQYRDPALLTPLEIGDRWYKPTDNGIANTSGDWFWNGTYWVSRQFIFSTSRNLNPTTGNITLPQFQDSQSLLFPSIGTNRGLFLETVHHQGGYVGGDTNNHRKLLLRAIIAGTGSNVIWTSPIKLTEAISNVVQTETLNIAYSFSGGQCGMRFDIDSVGSRVSAGNPAVVLFWRHTHP